MAAPARINVPLNTGNIPVTLYRKIDDPELRIIALNIANKEIPRIRETDPANLQTLSLVSLRSLQNITSSEIYNAIINTLDEDSFNRFWPILNNFVSLGGNDVTNKAQLRTLIDIQYKDLNTANMRKFAGIAPPSINGAHFNIYDLLDPVVLRRVTALKAKQLKNAMVTQQNIQNWMGMPGAQTVELTFRGGASLDPNVPLEMRGRGRVLFGAGGYFGLWQPLDDEGKMSEQFQDALDRATARLGTKLAPATVTALNREIAALKNLEDSAKVRSDQLKSVVSGFANGKIDSNTQIQNGRDLKNIADTYNATLAQINSKTNKITKALTLIINQS